MILNPPAIVRTLVCLSLLVAPPPPAWGEDGLHVSVYATAGEVLNYLSKPADRVAVARTCENLHISRIFLEGRRGDEYATPTLLTETRDFFEARGIKASGGIATVPGTDFGTRQNEALGWLNWEDAKTRRDVAGFFTENAPVFKDLIVDDFFCTADTSPESTRARGSRSWSAYRRDLLVSSIGPLIVQPALTASPTVRLILKFPQWYDRFHLFGYDPPRMMPSFDRIWVGTEVRDPQTRRMGFVQPTEGYMNFRWLTSIGGEKVVGAWFDHIECSAQNFVDQAYGSVLAGARELTLFHLGDLMEGNPGDALLAKRLPELITLEKRIHDQPRAGIAFYKPPGGDSDDNLYLMDYLGMIGLPILPVAQYPESAKVAFLAVQAAADPGILDRMRLHLRNGGTLVVTPAFVRRAGPAAARLAGVETEAVGAPRPATEMRIGRQTVPLQAPFQVDGALKAAGTRVLMEARIDEQSVPILTSRRTGGGRVLVLNTRTFSEADFGGTGEWLLAPSQLGLPHLPQAVADHLRDTLMRPLGVRLQAPSGVSLCLFRNGSCLYSFLDQPAEIRLNGKAMRLGPHECRWVWRTPN